MENQCTDNNRIIFTSSGTGYGKTIYQFYLNQKFVDTSIVLAGGKIIKVHGPIIAAESSVFYELLKTGSEGKNCLYMPEYSPKVMKYVLEFIYLGCVSVPIKLKKEISLAIKYFKLCALPGIEEEAPPNNDNIIEQKKILAEELYQSSEELFDSESEEEVLSCRKDKSTIVKNPFALKSKKKIQKSLVKASPDKQRSLKKSESTSKKEVTRSPKKGWISKNDYKTISDHFCVICNRKEKAIRVHIKTVHKKYIRTRNFKCKVCHQYFYLKETAREHPSVCSKNSS
ncbi:unnamed protein product [Diabrotica balteata]|uniref:BTB domain-containing protein n=1 Tax=Diabrotica balteata TaxID=107213 RepID=A0A9P0E2F2_DIABA|nr:unnamed protein product [Diabrotica balteata]